MTLPAHLARYDSLVDLLVDELVREIEAESSPSLPTDEKPAASWQTSLRVGDFKHEECNTSLPP
jgi:hypothetical protein